MAKSVEQRAILLLALFAFLELGCYQAERGCLDVEASNFNPAADEGCATDDNSSSCPCEYPTISFDTVSYKAGSLDYIPGNTYLNDQKQAFQIQNIQFYLSDFRFISNKEDSVRVTDTISLTVLNEEGETVKMLTIDDFVLVKQQTSIDIGMVKQSGQFEKICFRVGINESENTNDPQTVGSSRHPLADESMHFGDPALGYIFNKMVLNIDTSSAKEIILDIGGNNNLVEVTLPFSYTTTPGIHFSLPTLHINHLKWFDGINFVADTEAVMIKKIVDNTPNVFSIGN